MMQVREQHSRETKNTKTTISTKLTLFSEGDTSQVQALINQWPSECLPNGLVLKFSTLFILISDPKCCVTESRGYWNIIIIMSYSDPMKPWKYPRSYLFITPCLITPVHVLSYALLNCTQFIAQQHIKLLLLALNA